jgi:hypothetical protein
MNVINPRSTTKAPLEGPRHLVSFTMFGNEVPNGLDGLDHEGARGFTHGR